VVDGIGVCLPLWTAETSIISFAAYVPFATYSSATTMGRNGSAKILSTIIEVTLLIITKVHNAPS
jgi:hypothetical protein